VPYRPFDKKPNELPSLSWVRKAKHVDSDSLKEYTDRQSMTCWGRVFQKQIIEGKKKIYSTVDNSE